MVTKRDGGDKFLYFKN